MEEPYGARIAPGNVAAAFSPSSVVRITNIATVPRGDPLKETETGTSLSKRLLTFDSVMEEEDYR